MHMESTQLRKSMLVQQRESSRAFVVVVPIFIRNV